MPRPASWQGGEQGIYGFGCRELAAFAVHADVMCDGMLRMCRSGAELPRLRVSLPGQLRAIGSCRREGDRLWPRFLLTYCLPR